MHSSIKSPKPSDHSPSDHTKIFMNYKSFLTFLRPIQIVSPIER